MRHLNIKSRFLILLLGFLTIGISQVWGYTISFKDNGNSDDGTSAKTSKSDLISSGADYVSSISANYAYNGKQGYGVKLGSSSKAGNVTLNLSTDGQICASAVSLNIAYYDSDKTAKVTLTYTDNTTSQTTVSSLTQTVSAKAITVESTKTIKTIKIESVTASKGRVYIASIVLTPASEKTDVYLNTKKCLIYVS